jgi:hypothetical protein
VIDYNFYNVGNNSIPVAKQSTIGDSFCDDPSWRMTKNVCVSSPQRGPVMPNTVLASNPQQSPNRHTGERGFFEAAPSSHSSASVAENPGLNPTAPAIEQSSIRTDEVAAAIAVLNPNLTFTYFQSLNPNGSHIAPTSLKPHSPDEVPSTSSLHGRSSGSSIILQAEEKRFCSDQHATVSPRTHHV